MCSHNYCIQVDSSLNQLLVVDRQSYNGLFVRGTQFEDERRTVRVRRRRVRPPSPRRPSWPQVGLPLERSLPRVRCAVTHGLRSGTPYLR